MNIQDTPAIVTGGASGLGAATARMLTEHGARVTLFDQNADLGAQTAADIGARFAEVDVRDAERIDHALAEAEQANGVAQILINCAGIAPAMRLVGKDGSPHSAEVFRNAIEINLIGTFNVMSRFAARLAAVEPAGEEHGVIVNTASIAAFEGQIGQAAYASSKGGVASLTLPAARELARHRIRVVAIAPGLFETPMMAGLPQAARDSLGEQVPHPSRLGKPAEFATLVKSILDNPMLNGEVIRLDGAIRMAPR
jgi:NAD(P)-dependent dehydrogenase (short-subunit alcohol dehydrogenase family)